LLSILAGFALGLAATGLFTLLQFSVAQQRGEIGLRIAVRAAPAHVFRLIFREGLVDAIMGITAGLTAAGLLGALAGKLFGSPGFDPAAFAAATATLIFMAMLAAALPAADAAKIQPKRALNGE